MESLPLAATTSHSFDYKYLSLIRYMCSQAIPYNSNIKQKQSNEMNYECRHKKNRRRSNCPSIHFDDDDDDNNEDEDGDRNRTSFSNTASSDSCSSTSNRTSNTKRKRIDYLQTNRNHKTLSNKYDAGDGDSVDTTEFLRSLQQQDHLTAIPSTAAAAIAGANIPYDNHARCSLTSNIDDGNDTDNGTSTKDNDKTTSTSAWTQTKPPQQNNSTASTGSKKSTGGIPKNIYTEQKESLSQTSIETVELLRRLTEQNQSHPIPNTVTVGPDAAALVNAEVFTTATAVQKIAFTDNITSNYSSHTNTTDANDDEDEFVLPDESDSNSDYGDNGNNDVDNECEYNNLINGDETRNYNQSYPQAIDGCNVRQGLSYSREQSFSPFLSTKNNTNKANEHKSPIESYGMKENIEYFSDDEYAYDHNHVGYGTVATNLLLQQQQRSHQQKTNHDRNNDNVKTLTTNCKNNPKNKSSHSQGTIPNLFQNIATKKGFNQGIDNGKQRTEEHYKQQSIVQSSMRRRIRDPSQPLMPQPSTATKISSMAKASFSLSQKSTTNAIDNPARVSIETYNIANYRNDVTGGSGVGVNSYQLCAKKVTKTIESDGSSEDDVESPEVVAVVPKKRPTRRTASSYNKKSSKAKASTATNRRNKSESGGGKVSRYRRKGKWGKKQSGSATGRRTGSVATTASAYHRNSNNSRQHNRSISTTSASTSRYNTDDPHLRHIGGAEMSF